MIGEEEKGHRVRGDEGRWKRNWQDKVEVEARK